MAFAAAKSSVRRISAFASKYRLFASSTMASRTSTRRLAHAGNGVKSIHQRFASEPRKRRSPATFSSVKTPRKMARPREMLERMATLCSGSNNLGARAAKCRGDVMPESYRIGVLSRGIGKRREYRLPDHPRRGREEKRDRGGDSPEGEHDSASQHLLI